MVLHLGFAPYFLYFRHEIQQLVADQPASYYTVSSVEDLLQKEIFGLIHSVKRHVKLLRINFSISMCKNYGWLLTYCWCQVQWVWGYTFFIACYWCPTTKFLSWSSTQLNSVGSRRTLMMLVQINITSWMYWSRPRVQIFTVFVVQNFLK